MQNRFSSAACHDDLAFLPHVVFQDVDQSILDAEAQAEARQPLLCSPGSAASLATRGDLWLSLLDRSSPVVHARTLELLETTSH